MRIHRVDDRQRQNEQRQSACGGEKQVAETAHLVHAQVRLVLGQFTHGPKSLSERRCEFLGLRVGQASHQLLELAIATRELRMD